MEKVAVIVEKDGKYYVYSHDRSKKLGGPYDTREAAVKRLHQVEYFKQKKAAESPMADDPKKKKKSEDENEETADSGKGKGDKKPQVKAKDVVDVDAEGTSLADFFSPFGWGGRRAGKAHQLAKATDQAAPFSVRWPQISTILGVLGGGFGGGAAGAALGGVTAGSKGVTVGSAVGSVAGSIAGAVLATYYRRKGMREIADKFDKYVAEKGMPTGEAVEAPDRSILSHIFAPLSSSHWGGRIDSQKHMQTGEPENTGWGRHLLYGAQYPLRLDPTGGLVRAPLMIGGAWAEGIADEYRRPKKAASDARYQRVAAQAAEQLLKQADDMPWWYGPAKAIQGPLNTLNKYNPVRMAGAAVNRGAESAGLGKNWNKWQPSQSVLDRISSSPLTGGITPLTGGTESKTIKSVLTRPSAKAAPAAPQPTTQPAAKSPQSFNESQVVREFKDLQKTQPAQPMQRAATVDWDTLIKKIKSHKSRGL